MPQPVDKGKPITAAKQKKVKDFLKAHNHAASKIDKADFTDTSKMKVSMCDLHGVTTEQYQAAGGDPTA